jgi:hypothetical protein|tara:strand:- start:567 stop:899 length:333 start_codon:yes stop_codon:yes gene_type:complete
MFREEAKEARGRRRVIEIARVHDQVRTGVRGESENVLCARIRAAVFAIKRLTLHAIDFVRWSANISKVVCPNRAWLVVAYARVPYERDAQRARASWCVKQCERQKRERVS